MGHPVEYSLHPNNVGQNLYYSPRSLHHQFPFKVVKKGGLQLIFLHRIQVQNHLKTTKYLIQGKELFYYSSRYFSNSSSQLPHISKISRVPNRKQLKKNKKQVGLSRATLQFQVYKILSIVKISKLDPSV